MVRSQPISINIKKQKNAGSKPAKPSEKFDGFEIVGSKSHSTAICKEEEKLYCPSKYELNFDALDKRDCIGRMLTKKAANGIAAIRKAGTLKHLKH